MATISNGKSASIQLFSGVPVARQRPFLENHASPQDSVDLGSSSRPEAWWSQQQALNASRYGRTLFSTRSSEQGSSGGQAESGNWFQRQITAVGGTLGWATESAVEGAGSVAGAVAAGASRVPGLLVDAGSTVASVSHILPGVDEEDSRRWSDSLDQTGDRVDAALTPIGDRVAGVYRDFTSGLGEQVGEMVEGPFQMAAHPVQTAQGIVEAVDAIRHDPRGFVEDTIESVGDELAQDYQEGGIAKVVGTASGIAGELILGSKGIGAWGGRFRPGRGNSASPRSGNHLPGELENRSELPAHSASGSVSTPQDPAPSTPPRVEYQPSSKNYGYRHPRDFDPQRSAYDPARLAETIREAVEGRERSGFSGQSLSLITVADEMGAILGQSKDILRAAVQEGRITAHAAKFAHGAVIEMIVKDLRSGGVRLHPETVQTLVRDRYQVSRETSESVQRRTLTPEDRAFRIATARRAMQPVPDRITVGDNEVAVYNAKEANSTLGIAHIAVGDMARIAPLLARNLGEIHFVDNLRTSTSRGSLSDGGTITAQGGSYGTMNDPVIAQEFGADRAGSTINVAINTPLDWDTPRDTIGKRVERTQARRGTIYHETAHLLDAEMGSSRGFWSETSPDSPFHTVADAPTQDFVSDYARTSPAEDFAETVRVVMELAVGLDPKKLPKHIQEGPISESLRQKLIITVQKIGADPAVLEAIPNWRTEP